MTEAELRQFHIRTAAYEGPLELVLELIEKRKLLVNDLSLVQITDDFIQHVKSQAEFPMEQAADSIQVAATLLLIKSKSLLPDLELSDEEEQDVEAFKRRLALYEIAREAARELSRIAGRSVMYPAGEQEQEPMFAPSRDLTMKALEKALSEALAALEKEQVLPETRVRSVVTIEEMMDKLLVRVQKALTLSFKEFSGEAKEKVDIIVSFLALLELVKVGKLDAHQHGGHGSDITIENLSGGVPKYE